MPAWLLCLHTFLHSFRFLALVPTLLQTLPFDLDPRAENFGRILPLMESPHPLVPHPRGERFAFPSLFAKLAMFFRLTSSHVSHLSEPQPGSWFLSVLREKERKPTRCSWRTAVVNECRASSRWRNTPVCFCAVRTLPISLSIIQSDAWMFALAHTDTSCVETCQSAAGSAFTHGSVRACAHMRACVCMFSVKLQFGQDCFIIL